ncbi:MAG: hypothetical protein R6U44_04675 [Archaeoglobaceae archaeon]
MILNRPVSRTELTHAWQELAYKLRKAEYSYKTIYKSLMGVDELRKWGQIKINEDNSYSLTKAGIEKLKYLDVVYGLPIKPEWLDKYHSPKLEGKDVVGVCGNKYCKKVLETKFRKAENPSSQKYIVKI